MTTLPHLPNNMPVQKKKMSFRRQDGTLVTFKCRPKRKSPTTRAQLEKRLSKLKSPKMRAMARAKWFEAHSP